MAAQDYISSKVRAKHDDSYGPNSNPGDAVKSREVASKMKEVVKNGS